MIVYKLTCWPSGKIYIGITRRSLHRRVMKHFADAGRQEWPESRWLFCAMRHFPRSQWTAEVIASADSWTELLDLERTLISRFRANDPAIGYNRTAGGQGTLGMKQTPKTVAQRAAVSLFHRGRKRPPETRELLRQHALRRWRENPAQFPGQGDARRDAAIARRYFHAGSYREAGLDFGIGGAAACHAVHRFQRKFCEWADAGGLGPADLPKRLHPSWIEMMELSL